MEPPLSLHFQSRTPSAIRLTQIEFLKRSDRPVAVNTAIGNVCLPMHPSMTQRMFSLRALDSPFRQGIVKYSTTVGEKETNNTFLHLIHSSGFPIQGLYTQVTDGGSQAIELAILGICGQAGSCQSPLLLIDPTYSNYKSMAERTGRSTISVMRYLNQDGKFALPELSVIEKVIQEKNPSGLLVIPYDNPTGQFFPQETLNALGKLCVKYNLWMLSDEAYREVFYTKDKASSIWGITEKDVPGMTGRRISIESASKIWDACGLRIGALVTDNKDFHEKAVAENTANLCANVIGQFIFGALLHEPKEKLQAWFHLQRTYYRQIAEKLNLSLKQAVPDLIVSKPDAALYTVVDLRKIFSSAVNTTDFAMYCAQKGEVELRGVKTTLLFAPMSEFYSSLQGEENPGKTQIRIAYVEPAEVMADVPQLLAQLLRDFLKTL